MKLFSRKSMRKTYETVHSNVLRPRDTIAWCRVTSFKERDNTPRHIFPRHEVDPRITSCRELSALVFNESRRVFLLADAFSKTRGDAVV